MRTQRVHRRQRFHFGQPARDRITTSNNLYYMQNTAITMKVKNSENTFTTAILTVPGRGLCALAVLIALACMPSPAQSHQDKSNHYRQVNLVSDLPGVA